MTLKEHPGRQLKKSWIEHLRVDGPAAEAAGRLTSRQMALFYDQGWFKALAPKCYGGLQWDLSRIVRFEEAIGWAEGSAGWTFTLCSGAGWFGGFMEAGFANKVFGPKKACLAGSGAIGGTAVAGHGGTLVADGSWKYATGAPFATLFTANYQFSEDRKTKGKKNKDQRSQQNQKGLTDNNIFTYGFLPGEVSVENNWTATGLKASASWAFSVRQVALKPRRGFAIDPDSPVVDEVLYRFPFMALAEATIAANLSGMALHFLEEAEKLWIKQGKMTGGKTKRDKMAGKASTAALGLDYVRYLDRQAAKWQAASTALHQSVGSLESVLKDGWQKNLSYIRKNNKPSRSWKNITATKRYAQKARAVSIAAQQLAKVCRRIVFDVYGHTGLSGASQAAPINKVWRDFQTGSQHALFEEALQ